LATRALRIAVVGPSGAGKTTFLRILAGLEPATGRIAVRGVTWLDGERRVRLPPWRRGAAWVPQEARLFPHRSARSNLAFGGATDEDVAAVAGRLGIEGLLDRMPRHLSGGECQRVALGRALLSHPRLLLLDEPFSALDRRRRDALSALLRELSVERDLPMVLVSHDERDVAALAEEVFEIADGCLQAAAAPAD
jgi:molybdate transport system ATP-binding protein